MSGFLSSFNITKANNSGREDSTERITTDMRFTIQPITPGESGFSQWVAAMKMVAQLPGGIPPEFRRRLWVTMAERHLASRGVDWSEVEKTCFGDWSHRADDELGIQIVKDLHRTGCSLFCGDEGQQNQVLLKKVLMAYARWNKAVGYCQGFNMLAALILQVTDRCASDALKLMIYLIEGVLPDSYFADSLRGLSVDMAVFRELLRSKLPRLSKHLDLLQTAAKDGSRSYEPPLTNVFTMQWFLTLFCNCLPHPTVLRVWDLIFLEGNAVLLRTALAIWQVFAQRILLVRTADEFYCVMGALTRELLESNLIDANTLIKAIVDVGPITELKSLRDHYLYNITPWGAPAPTTRPIISLHPKMDIGALKQQYVKLKQRQRQAHVIFTSAVSGRPAPAATPVMNHLLVGKRALGPSKRPGPPKGSIPPARQHHPSTLHWKDATQTQCSSSSSSDTELCDEDDVPSSEEEKETDETSQFETNLDNSKPNILVKSESLTPSPSLKIPSDCDQSAEFLSSDSLTPSPSPKVPSDSEEGDESAEFERFLADRLKGDQAARRNSELALQIIQENSLILHRIMQCQSRLSPSPPLLGKNDCDAKNNFNPSSSLLAEPMEDDFEAVSIEDYPDSTQIIKYDLEPISCPQDDSDQTLSFENKQPIDYSQLALPINEPQLLDDSIKTPSELLIKVDFDQPIKNDFGLISPLPKTPTIDIKDESSQLPLFLGENFESLLDSKIQSIKDEFDPINSEPIKIPKLLVKDDSKFEHKDNDTNQYSSRLRSLLEKSKSLDEKYNFILSKDKLTPTLGGLHESKSEEPLSLESDKDNKSSQLIQENLHLLKTYSANKIKEERSNLSRKLFRENVCLLESISSKSDGPLIDFQSPHSAITSQNDVIMPDNNVLSQISDDNCDNFAIDSSKSISNINDFDLSMPQNSPVKSHLDDNCDKFESTTSTVSALSPISPNHAIFNPFPVSINSRQSKEVAVKLGLYKK